MKKKLKMLLYILVIIGFIAGILLDNTVYATSDISVLNGKGSHTIRKCL